MSTDTSVENSPQGPCALSIEGVYPNPFNMNTSISFNVPTEGVFELGIYNLAGQRVRWFVSSCNHSGVQQVVWNGCDDSGSRVSSGVYIVCLRMGVYIDSAKLTVIK